MSSPEIPDVGNPSRSGRSPMARVTSTRWSALVFEYAVADVRSAQPKFKFKVAATKPTFFVYGSLTKICFVRRRKGGSSFLDRVRHSHCCRFRFVAQAR